MTAAPVLMAGSIVQVEGPFIDEDDVTPEEVGGVVVDCFGYKCSFFKLFGR